MSDPVPARWRAYICCGPRCTEHRSPALLDVLQREVDRAGVGTEVEVLPGGCQKHCERGPSLVIWPGPVYYERIDIGRLRRIVREHLAGGCP
ncbi:MAG: (2Fe-2S) ferredoxin domain-containing protein, partial [Chloroflexota bacterium]|nr:(2Fe-2S) ferredoxin domain-containing protein [Chloroflexota bacterium]